jgi:hypothetical protein
MGPAVRHISNLPNVSGSRPQQKQLKSNKVSFMPLPSGSIGNKTEYTYMK